MAQILVTLDSLRAYARSLDERLVNVQKYNDAWVDSKINAAYELVATRRQPFIKEEVLDLHDYILDGTAKFEIDMDEDLVGYRDIYSTTPKPTAIRWNVTPDNKVMIELEVSLLDETEENLITLNYYFFPNTKTGDQYMSTDVYHMVRHGVASSIFDALQDYEKRDNYDQQLDYNTKTMVNGLDYFGDDVRKANWIDSSGNWI